MLALRPPPTPRPQLECVLNALSVGSLFYIGFVEAVHYARTHAHVATSPVDATRSNAP